MQQLSGLDSIFLSVESRRTPTHVSGLIVLDPSSVPGGFGIDRLRKLMEERIHLVPVMRRRLQYVPRHLDHPYWLEDPDFELDYHLRHRALPKPGNAAQLEELVCQIFMRTLDRTRPLWELYLIEGLESGQVAIMTKMHHACIDGVSGAEIMATLLDLTPQGRNVPGPDKTWKPDIVPTEIELLGRTLRNYLKAPKRAWELLPSVMASAVNLGKLALAPQLDFPKTPYAAPRSIFNRPASQRRRFAWGSIDLNDVKEVKDAFGVSVNDVVLALCSSTLRNYCLSRDALPGEPLLAMVPVSVRTEEQRGTAGNQVSSMFTPLATQIADPIERLRAIHNGMISAKIGHHAIGATTLQDWSQFAAPAVAGLANRMISRLGTGDGSRPPMNVVISNVPGPRMPLYFAGAKVLATYPVSVTMENVSLNITVQSYQDAMDFGIVADRAAVPDAWPIFEGLKKGLAEYKKLAKTKPVQIGKPKDKKKKAA